MTTVQPFDASVNLLRALLWQHDSAVRLRALLEAKQAWYDEHQASFWGAWARDVFDLRTANDFGLSVWAILLGVPLVFDAPATGARSVFGFGVFNRNFGRGNFGRDAAAGVSLTTEQKRLVLRLRYFQLVTRGAVTEVNAFLSELLGNVYVLDGEDMTAVYVFRDVPDAGLRQVLDSFDLLPRPAGVEVSYRVEPGNSFGFAPYWLNFENGNFYYGG